MLAGLTTLAAAGSDTAPPPQAAMPLAKVEAEWMVDEPPFGNKNLQNVEPSWKLFFFIFFS